MKDEQISQMVFTSSPAVSLGIFDIEPKEMLFYLYLPIKMIDSGLIEIPKRLQLYYPLVQKVLYDHYSNYPYDIGERYLYLTAKTLFVTPDNIGNRPGYHCDGFGTDDVNYLWYDKHPTIFNSGTFDVRMDDTLALLDMEAQAKAENEYSFPEKSLIRIDSLTMHRTPVITTSGVRTFVKISVSKHRYNLQGNSHNYLFNYDWTLHERSDIRNMENKDYQN
ncbi:hypothetical protein GCM10028807_58190 [Spirosoma daeguense]